MTELTSEEITALRELIAMNAMLARQRGWEETE